MISIKRSALVGYTQRQMFELVNAIEEYPRFLPWCTRSDVISRSDTEVMGNLEVSWSGIHKEFTTRNQLVGHEKMIMILEKGPFKHFQGVWDFIALGEKGCKVCLDLEFELSHGIMNKLFEPIFNNIANSLVDAFCKRAVEIYGNES